MKYILVSGGVLSGIGKGVCASSTGLLLRLLGLRVTAIKIDPYLNIDAGTMSPFEHGEVYVLNDGGEVDLDLGNYERFMDISLSRDNNITTGKVYQSVIERERKGEYLGKTVQVVPHICEAIQEWIEDVAHRPADGGNSPPDVCVIELGGTVGDIESGPFIEAMRQFQFRVGTENFMNFHVSLVPIIHGEQKTKPTQQSVQRVRALGLQPDLIVCRSETPLNEATKQKISLFCHVPPENVIACHNVPNLYHVPIVLNEQGVVADICRRLSLQPPRAAPQLDGWRDLALRVDALEASAERRIRIAVVGKYTGFSDAYASLIKALKHAALTIGVPLAIDWIDAERLVAATGDASSPSSSSSPTSSTSSAATPGASDEWTHGAQTDDLSSSASLSYDQRRAGSADDAIEPSMLDILARADGILVPGGFGNRGVEGKICAVNYARRHEVPFLGICLGMQVAVIEYARNVLHWHDANSEEFAPNVPHKVVVYMPEISRTHMGGTMRLGSRRTWFFDDAFDSLSARLYHPCSKNEESDDGGNDASDDASAASQASSTAAAAADAETTRIVERGEQFIDERHRHRYEVNPSFVEQFEDAGLIFVGRDETGKRMSIIELDTDVHPYFVGCQFHPEFTSRPHRPNPLFIGLMASSAKRSLSNTNISDWHSIAIPGLQSLSNK
jgi:CTP synthase